MSEFNKESLFNIIDDLITNFLYYDRKEDESLPVGAIEQAIKKGKITADEIINRFKEQLTRNLK